MKWQLIQLINEVYAFVTLLIFYLKNVGRTEKKGTVRIPFLSNTFLLPNISQKRMKRGKDNFFTCAFIRKSFEKSSN